MLFRSSAARRWRWTGLALAGSTLALFLLQTRAEPFRHGGSSWGLGWGIAALALLLLLLAFGLRKRAYRSRLGTLEGWLQGHVVLGLWSVVVVLLHAGERFEDRLALGTFLVLVVVVVSGIVGVLLYILLPRRLTEVGSNRTASEISEQLNQITQSMARLAVDRSPQFQRLAASLVAGSKPGWLSGWRLLARGPKARARVQPAWRRMLGEVPAAERDELRQLLVLSRQHEELLGSLLAEQYYRNWLDAWLYVHLPLSIALLVLVVAHVGVALYYRGL